MSDPYGCSTGRHFYPEKCSCVSTGFEDGRHHLQRTELEALRAELAEMTNHFHNACDDGMRLEVTLKSARAEADGLTQEIEAYRSERDTLRAEVERLTKGIEDDGIHPWTVAGVQLVTAENEKLRVRAQELEGALRKILKSDEGWAHQLARAALESGTEPVRCRACDKALLPENRRIADGCPCNSPRGVNHGIVEREACTCSECDPSKTGSSRAPAPKTFTVEEIEKAFEDWRISPVCDEYSWPDFLALLDGGEK